MLKNLIPTSESIAAYLANNPNKVLLYRTCRIENGRLFSYEDFEWPTTLRSHVRAPDWDSEPVCGGGLFALRPGHKDPGVWYYDGAWLVVAADADKIVDLHDEKCKAPEFEIIAIAYTNGRSLIPQLFRDLGYTEPLYRATVIDDTKDAVINVGNYGSAIVGSNAKASGDFKSVLVGGLRSKITSGFNGTAITGMSGHAEVRSYGTAIAGESGFAKAGHGGLALVGEHGSVAAGANGIIQAWYYDCRVRKLRVHIGYVGETLDINGQVLLPDQYYHCHTVDSQTFWVLTQEWRLSFNQGT